MSQPSRRDIVRAAFALGGFGVAGAAAYGQDRAPTPQCHDGDAPTQPQTEGPFYKPQSPARFDLVERGTKAGVVELRGRVLTRNCRPVPRALVDLWHADGQGAYDNRGFRYRGHVLTDAQGRFRFRTIVPARYPGRTRHYHVKVAGGGAPLLTTQLYFPDEPQNRRDGLFRPELLMRTAAAEGAMTAQFDFILDLRS